MGERNPENNRRRRIDRLLAEDPALVVSHILENLHWPHALKPCKTHTRLGDDNIGSLHVVFNHAGDSWIEVIAINDRQDLNGPLEFRTKIRGGQSPRVLVALLMLAKAIDDDNRENPQHRKERRTA